MKHYLSILAVLLGTAGAANAQLAALSAASQWDHHVVIVNATSETMLSFHASRAGIDSWQEDIWGREVLPSGNSVRVNLEDGSGGCFYDFRAEFANGEVLTRYAVNVCAIRTYTYSAY